MVTHLFTGCSASGVRNAISTLKWLENEDSKYMSHSLRQRHLQSKMKMVDDWKQSRNMEGVKGPDGGGDGDRGSGVDPGSADSTSLTGLVKERDEESKAENLDSENSNSNIMSAVEDEEDDEEILDQDDLHCTPSLSELTADICPYKDKHGHGVSALREDKTDDIRTTSGKDVEKEKDFTSPPKKKGRWPEKDKDSSSPKNQKDVAKKINLKGKGNLDSEFQTKAGLRAEEGDYSGLLVNGLFASSVLRTGSYYKAKDKAIVKVFTFKDFNVKNLNRNLANMIWSYRVEILY